MQFSTGGAALEFPSNLDQNPAFNGLTLSPGTGLVLVYKVLEDSTFAWPKVQDGVVRLSRAQVQPPHTL